MAEINTQPGIATNEHWEERWESGTSGWHQLEVDAYLKKHVTRLTRSKPSFILVPWCGKSVDMPWLCEQGHTVVGVELSELAVIEFVKENRIPHSVSEKDGFKVYTAIDRKLTVYCGNMFDFNAQIAGCTFDAIWDHHALGAVNPADRKKHIAVLQTVLKPHGRILLSHFEYDRTQYVGPPFSLSPSLIIDLFKETFDVERVDYIELPDSYPAAKKFNLTWLKRPIHLLSYSLKFNDH